MYKAIIFDIDGTLADTNQLILESFNFISLKYLNSKFDFNELTKYFGPPENYLFQQLLKIILKMQHPIIIIFMR